MLTGAGLTLFSTFFFPFFSLGDVGVSLEGDCITLLSQYLQGSMTLVSLDISGCGIAPHCEVLFGALKCNNHLRHLTIVGNEIDDSAARFIGDFLMSNASLLSLNLNSKVITVFWVFPSPAHPSPPNPVSENNIGNKGSQAISFALMQNDSLKSLSLIENNITDQGIHYLVDSLLRNFSIHSLAFGGVHHFFLPTLSKLGKPTHVDYFPLDEGIGKEGIFEVARLIEGSSCILSLHIESRIFFSSFPFFVIMEFNLFPSP